MLVQGWPYAVDLPDPERGRALILDERLRAWLAGRDWKRGHWPGPTGSCYRFAIEADADAFAAEFGGTRSS